MLEPGDQFHQKIKLEEAQTETIVKKTINDLAQKCYRLGMNSNILPWT